LPGKAVWTKVFNHLLLQSIVSPKNSSSPIQTPFTTINHHVFPNKTQTFQIFANSILSSTTSLVL